MANMLVRLASMFLFMAYSGHCFPYSEESELGPEDMWAEMEKFMFEEDNEPFVPELKKGASDDTQRRGSTYMPVEARKVPESIPIAAHMTQTHLLRPEKFSRTMPDSVRDILLATAPPTTPAPTSPKLMEVLCHLDRMYVRIRKDVFNRKDAYKHLTLGSCRVNQATSEHYYMLYYLEGCGIRMESNADSVLYTNVLNYNPHSSGPIMRQMSFSVPVVCQYNRFFRSHKVGVHPRIRGGTVFKSLKAKAGVTLTPYDETWTEFTSEESFTVGHPMYFEAKNHRRTGQQRVYINRCYMTASQDPNSTPKYIVIANYGCMVDSLITDQSKFIPQSSKTALKFSVGAFIFTAMVSDQVLQKRLYMHCEITMGATTPTPSAKSCNYNANTQRWTELYGDDSVCNCCSNSCPPLLGSGYKKMITSDPWAMDYKKNRLPEPSPEVKAFVPDISTSEQHSGFLDFWDGDF